MAYRPKTQQLWRDIMAALPAFGSYTGQRSGNGFLVTGVPGSAPDQAAGFVERAVLITLNEKVVSDWNLGEVAAYLRDKRTPLVFTVDAAIMFPEVIVLGSIDPDDQTALESEELDLTVIAERHFDDAMKKLKQAIP